MSDEPEGTDPVPRSAVLFGGAGFIGTHLSRYLAERGCAVTSVDLMTRPDGGSDTGSVRQVVWDVRSAIPTDLCDPPEVTFNLAAIHRTPGHPDAAYFETNVSGARTVTD